MSLEVVCQTATYTTNIDVDKPLSFLIQQSGVPMDLQCAGHGICGKCRVELGEGNIPCT